MADYNFGMMSAGLPDFAQRQVSAPVQDQTYFTNQNNAYLADWQGRYDAAAPVYHAGSGGGGGTASTGPSFLDVLSGWGYSPGDPNSPWDAAIDSALSQGWDGGGGGGGSPGYYDDSARQALNAERDKTNATYQAQIAPLAQNQQTQQNAYNNANGGTFNGGIINSSYSTPFGQQGGINGTTAVDGVTMPQNQSWSSPSYGGPMGAASLGGFGAGLMGQPDASQPAGWGGPFTNKNPWAAS